MEQHTQITRQADTALLFGATGKDALVKTAVPDHGTTGSFEQVQTGAGGVASCYLNQIMSLYSQLMDLSMHQTQDELKAAGSASQAASQAAIASADAQSAATVCQAAGYGVSAGMDLVSLAGTFQQTKSSVDEIGQYNKEAETFGANRQALLKAPDVDTTIAATPTDPAAQQAQAAQQATIANNKQELIRNGKLSSGTPSDTENAIAHMNEQERDQFLETLNTKEKVASNRASDAQSRLQEKLQKLRSGTELAKQAGNSLTTGLQSRQQTKQGEAQARQTVSNTTASLAQGMASSKESMVGKYYDQELQALQMYQQVAANSQVRG